MMDLSRETIISIASRIFGPPGYSLDMRLSEGELDYLASAVRVCMLKRIDDAYREIPLNDYRTLTHHNLWGNKKHRILGETQVDMIKRFGVFARLASEFGPFRLVPIVYGHRSYGAEEVYFRVVRPHTQEDIALVHADVWFHDIFKHENGVPYVAHDELWIKVWIPVVCERGISGLAVIPNSHQQDWKYRVITRNGHSSPKVDHMEDRLQLLPTDPGQCIVFGNRLLHGGIVSQGKKTRISVEVALLFKR
jgi:hypothetical protein